MNKLNYLAKRSRGDMIHEFFHREQLLKGHFILAKKMKQAMDITARQKSNAKLDCDFEQ